MPVLMRVGGGGKKTKDATALPEDVRSGKTFYGKDGKQTGIWMPKVIDFTGDATATPDEVKKGEVFYNNDGRQVGSLDLSIGVLSKEKILFQKGSNNGNTHSNYEYIAWFSTGKVTNSLSSSTFDLNNPVTMIQTEYSEGFDFGIEYILPTPIEFEKIVNLKINGGEYECNFSKVFESNFSVRMGMYGKNYYKNNSTSEGLILTVVNNKLTKISLGCSFDNKLLNENVTIEILHY